MKSPAVQTIDDNKKMAYRANTGDFFKEASRKIPVFEKGGIK